MSLILPIAPSTASQRTEILKGLADRRESVGEQMRAAAFWARMKADPDFESVLTQGLLGQLYTEVDQAIDTCEVMDLPNLRAQRRMVSKLRSRIETEMNNGSDKLENLRQDLAQIEEETATAQALPTDETTSN